MPPWLLPTSAAEGWTKISQRIGTGKNFLSLGGTPCTSYAIAFGAYIERPLNTTTLPPMPTGPLRSITKRAITRPRIGIWNERLSIRTELTNLHKRLTVNRDRWRLCHRRNSMHDSHRKAAEYHSLAAHAHRTAAHHHGQEDHLTGHEHSRQALEHSNKAYQHSLQVYQGARTEHGVIGSLRRPERRTSPSSPINSGKLEALLRDHRKKIGSVRSKNCNLTNSRDGTYNVTYTQG